MIDSREIKEVMMETITQNSLYGQATSLNELVQGDLISFQDCFLCLDELVEDGMVQWASEEQLVPLPLPTWYMLRLQEVNSYREQAIILRTQFT